jgi:Fur family peroxide stress response transcriptional regulator
MAMWTVEEGIRRLKENGSKITTQRVAILERLQGRKDHPSADVLFAEMRTLFPALSIATIYSTAQVLQQCGLIRILSIDDRRVYFDPETGSHGHFFCRECGALLDLPWTAESFSEAFRLLPGAVADCAELFVYGLCPSCAASERGEAQGKGSGKSEGLTLLSPRKLLTAEAR